MSLASIALEDPKAAYCIGRTLPLEGGFVDDDVDEGGATNHGVSLRWALAEIDAHPDLARMLDVDHDGHVTRHDIAELTADEGADWFYQTTWRPGWYANIVPNLTAWKCFDIAVNAGPKRAAILLQKALVARGRLVAIDQVVGPKTILAVKAESEVAGGKALLDAIRNLQANFYSGLVAKEPKLRRFLDGWLKRAAA